MASLFIRSMCVGWKAGPCCRYHALTIKLDTQDHGPPRVSMRVSHLPSI